MANGKGLLQKILIPIFTFVYRRWLWNDFFNCYDRVIHVKGWRTARITTKSRGTVVTITPCFLWFK